MTSYMSEMVRNSLRLSRSTFTLREAVTKKRKSCNSAEDPIYRCREKERQIFCLGGND